MAEPVEEFRFSHKEVVEALIKKQGLNQGIWMLNIQFGIGALNVQPPDGEKGEVVPAAIVPIVSIGLRKVQALNALSVDAAQINPAQMPTLKKKMSAAKYLTTGKEE